MTGRKRGRRQGWKRERWKERNRDWRKRQRDTGVREKERDGGGRERKIKRDSR